MAARLTAYVVALIVGSTFIAGLIVGAQRPDDGPVDLMVVNGRVYTADGEGTTAEAVAIQGNKILRVGTTREIQRLRRPQTVVIDAKGGAVLPGFIETDARLFDAGPDAAVPAPIIARLPTATREEELVALRKAMAEAHRHGITSVQTLGGTARELELYNELRRENALSLRVYGALTVPPASTDEQIDGFDAIRAKFPDDPMLKAGAAHISLDGDDVSTQTLAQVVAELDRRNWQIVIHASGDRAVGMALDAFRQAIETNPAPTRGRRHRVEADEVVGPIDFGPFDALGVLHGWPGEHTSVLDAIDARTLNAAWASFDEQRKGSLARDMLADVIVLTRDILSLPSASLGDAEVSVTIFDGKVVFQRTTESDN